MELNQKDIMLVGATVFVLLVVVAINIFSVGVSQQPTDQPSSGESVVYYSEEDLNVQSPSNQTIDTNVCGDGACSLTEDCKSCQTDCTCGAGQTCSDAGLCTSPICGDSDCSTDERLSNSCCIDCGCQQDYICNNINQKCQQKVNLASDVVNETIANYISKNNIAGNILFIEDTYYGSESVKLASINCTLPNEKYPCNVMLFINSTGNIVNEMRTG